MSRHIRTLAPLALLVLGLVAGSVPNLFAQQRDSGLQILEANRNPSTDILITLRADNPAPRAGDEITLIAETNKDCHLTILYLGPSGDVVVFWPNRSSGWDDRVTANRPIEIPGPSADFRFKVDGKQPLENIVAYATTGKDPIFDRQEFRELPGGKVKAFARNARELERAFRSRVAQIPAGVGWGTASLTLRVATAGPGGADAGQSADSDECPLQGPLREVASNPGVRTITVSKDLDEKSLESLAEQLTSNSYEGRLGLVTRPGTLDERGRWGLRDFGPGEYLDPKYLLEFKPDLPKSVCGQDSRTRQTPCADPPWRWNCFLFITWADGTKGLCSGWLIGPRTVMTAGHCVYSQEQKAWAKSIQVAPGADGTSCPFGKLNATDFRSVDKWVAEGNRDFDFGAIILPTRELGEKVGHFGFQSLSTKALKQIQARTSGYPGDKPRGTQWHMGGPTDKVTCGQLFYMIDTYGGQSGSAVWVQDQDKLLAVGIHTMGGCPNKATRIRKPIFDLMMHWKEQ